MIFFCDERDEQARRESRWRKSGICFFFLLVGGGGGGGPLRDLGWRAGRKKDLLTAW